MPAAPAAPPAPPPQAPQAPKPPASTAPPPPPPAPTKAIQVSQMPTAVEPVTPPKPGTARERMFKDLQKKADEKAAKDAPVVEPTTAPPAPKDKSVPDKDTPKAEGEPDPTVPGEGTPPVVLEPTEKKSTSPWKVVDQWKARAATLEKELAEVKTKAIPEQERKSYAERMEKLETHNKELEDEIRFVKYESSTEFKTQYEEPYVKSWQTAMAELSEISVADPNTGESRAAAADDLMELVNLPLGKARAKANELFGDFAEDVMSHRKEIRALFDKRSNALSEAKKAGAERQKREIESIQHAQGKMAEVVKEVWEKANADLMADEVHGQYFKPVEGDQDGNQRLAKGYELVDRAFNESPINPELTADQRNSIIRRHVAVRNRAAGYGRMKLWLEQARAELAEAKTELAQYRGSEPSTGSDAIKPAFSSPNTSAKDRVFGALRKLAK